MRLSDHRNNTLICHEEKKSSWNYGRVGRDLTIRIESSKVDNRRLPSKSLTPYFKAKEREQLMLWGVGKNFNSRPPSVAYRNASHEGG
ncbi:unnamed protein product [Haemonchus placei]|uniref:Ovule protein n=1 Tax=Haemonchus placei TaxID=6290 RepID=A0A0N4X4W3_HAEPC|nr:unnamed protein product [Haemonchus placei]